MRPSDSAAASIIISPPTERPMPPIRSGSTSERLPEVGDGRVDVTLALPAEGVGIALALAFAATVEEEDAVAVAGEHPRRASAVRSGRGTR